MPIERTSFNTTSIEVNLFGNWGYMADQALFGHPILLCGLAGFVAQFVLIVVAIRRRSRIQHIIESTHLCSNPVYYSYSFWPEVISVGFLLLPLIVEGVSVYERLKSVAASLQPLDPSTTAVALSVSLKERNYGPLLASLMVAIQTIPAALMIALGAFYRHNLRGFLRYLDLKKQGSSGQSSSESIVEAYRKYPCPERNFFIAVALGIGGSLTTFWIILASFAANLIEIFAVSAGDPKDMRTQFLADGMEEIERHLFVWLTITAIVIVLVSVAAFVYLHFFSAATKRHRIAPNLPKWPKISNLKYIVAIALCLIGSFLFLAFAQPFYIEKNMPPLKRMVGGKGLYPVSKNYELEIVGPDKLKPSPLLQVDFRNNDSNNVVVTFDDYETSETQLEERALRSKIQWEHTYSRKPFPGTALIQCDGRVRLKQLLPYMHALYSAGFETVQLAFIKTTVVERPLLGRFPYQTESAANLELAPFYPSGIHILDSERIRKRGLPSREIYGLALPGDTRYEAFARAVVTVRRVGAKVLIAMGQSQ